MPTGTVDETVIVPARDEDGEALGVLIERIFGEYEGVLFVLAEMPELRCPASSFARAGGRFWTARHAGTVVGCVGFTPAADQAGIELRKLYVSREQRRSGLGARLVELVERAATERGAGFIELWSDVKFQTAHRFYERRGYVPGAQTRRLNDLSDTVERYFRKTL